MAWFANVNEQNLDSSVEHDFKKSSNSLFVVCCVGGHLVQALEAFDAYSDLDILYVVNDRVDLDEKMVGRTVVITHAERGFAQFNNLIESIMLVFRFRPKIIFSTGASPAVPFSIVAKLFFGSKIIFLESLSRVTSPSLTGRIMYYIADYFYIQWPSLKKVFPKAIFVGRLL